MMKKSLSDVLMEQHKRRSLINAANAINKRSTKKGIRHHNAKYTEDQIKDAKAIKIAFEQLGMRANIVAIAALTGINILSVRGLFRKVRPTWIHLHAEKWRVDRFKNEVNLHSMEKARMAKAKRMEWFNEPTPRVIQLRIIANRQTTHQGVNDFFAEICKLIGKEPETFNDFIAACDSEVEAGRLDADYYRRHKRNLYGYRFDLYPNDNNPLNNN